MGDGKSAESGVGLLAVAADRAVSGGVGAVSTRRVAEGAGLSASAVNYHFGGRSGLLKALNERFEADIGAWRQARRARLAANMPGGLSPASVVAALIFDSVGEARAGLLVLQELKLMASRGETDLVDAPASSWTEIEVFWREMLSPMGVEPFTAGIWATFAAGATDLALVGADPVVRFAWLAEASRRLGDRLSGAAVTPDDRPSAPEPSPEADAGAAAGRRRLIDAAIRLIGERGVDELTHRRIAAAAGLSLASTTYFFASKNEIVFEAFRELHRRALSAGDEGEAVQPLAEVLLTPSGAVRWEIGAMQALYIAASRDPSLRPFAASLGQVRGRSARRRLLAHGYLRIDALDGFVWSLIIGGLFNAALALPPERRADFVNNTSERSADTIFGNHGRASAG